MAMIMVKQSDADAGLIPHHGFWDRVRQAAPRIAGRELRKETKQGAGEQSWSGNEMGETSRGLSRNGFP